MFDIWALFWPVWVPAFAGMAETEKAGMVKEGRDGGSSKPADFIGSCQGAEPDAIGGQLVCPEGFSDDGVYAYNSCSWRQNMLNKTVTWLQVKAKRVFLGLAALILSVNTVCAWGKSEGLGEVARNLHKPVLGIIELVKNICLIAGVGLIVGAVIKYKQHRKNPVEVRLSSVFTLLLLGLALIALTFIPIGNA